MTDDILLTIGKDGKASLYDDTYDITIHCESQEEQDEVKRVLQNVPHWIPVTERLPEDDVFVLLTVRRMDDSYNHVPFISTGYISWNHQCWWCAHDGNCKDANVEVLAWMPLPEAFKAVTDGRD